MFGSPINTGMSIMTFADYIDSTADIGLNESVLCESLSGAVAKTAMVGILAKLYQLRQSIVQDRSASKADRSIASMLFLLAGLVSVGIGTIDNDSGLVSQARRSVS